ncbi:MAG TPA: hypothetical protein VI895_06705 [Bdellovibrionota bacterium]|nr:hypothetical protein [Bdellovibrionota bacterium]
MTDFIVPRIFEPLRLLAKTLIPLFGLVSALTSFSAQAGIILDSTPEASLTFPKGDGYVGFDTHYRLSDQFFDSSGSLTSTFPDGGTERFHDVQFTIESAYGLTNELTIWLNFPLAYRMETDLLRVDTFGLGDVRAGVHYRFWGGPEEVPEMAFGVFGKFPSGGTAIGFSDPTRGVEPDLPLGDGSLDLTPIFLAKQHLARTFSLEEAVSYTFRFDSLVEYLRTDPVSQTAPDGTIYSLPVGNLEIDWGDEVDLRLRLAWKFLPPLTLAGEGHYFYRRSTELRGFALSVINGSLAATPASTSLSSGYVVSVRPSLLWEFGKEWALRVAAEIPLKGESYPNIPLVESLVGNAYQCEVRHAF